MSSNNNQNSFQERLARLEGKKPNAKPDPKASEPKPTLERPDYSKPKISMVRQIQVWGFVIIVLLLAGAYLLNTAMPGIFSPKVASLESAGTETETTANEVENAAPPIAISIVQSDQGAIYGARTVLGFDGADAVVGDFVFRSQDAPEGKNPTTTAEFEFNSACELRRPVSGENVMGVRLAATGQVSDVAAFDKGEMARKLLSGLQVSTEFRRSIRLGETEERKSDYTQLGQFDGSMNVVDVLLTDASEPVYLVLQTRGGRIIWNLHMAPGVTLAHVVMIAQGKVGLSGLPNGTTFEALRISDFVEPHFFGADDEPRDCMIRPWRKPQPNWIAWQKAQNSPGLQANMIETFTKGYAAYDRWYQGAFGVSASTNTVAAQSADHVLLGPKPPEKFQYRPIAGNDLVVIKSDFLIVGDLATRRAQTAQLHSEMMQAALGGDLTTLWPDAMQGESQ